MPNDVPVVPRAPVVAVPNVGAVEVVPNNPLLEVVPNNGAVEVAPNAGVVPKVVPIVPVPVPNVGAPVVLPKAVPVEVEPLPKAGAPEVAPKTEPPLVEPKDGVAVVPPNVGAAAPKATKENHYNLKIIINKNLKSFILTFVFGSRAKRQRGSTCRGKSGSIRESETHGLKFLTSFFSKTLK